MTLSVEASIGWLDPGTAFFEKQAAAVELTAPSNLPDWTNGHVVAHVARNAEAVHRLLQWARTGVETPMYSSPEARTADIERDAGRPRDVALADVRATAAAFDAELAEMDDAAWSAPVRTSRGAPARGGDVPWMRVKEVWLHAVDIGASLEAFPADLAAALLADVGGSFDNREDAPGVRLVPSDSAPAVVVRGGGVEVGGTGAQLVAWLTGRSDGSRLTHTGVLPTVPPWL